MARKRRHSPPSPPAEETPLQRYQRYRRKGQQRKALLVLRDACYADEGNALLWTIYGAQCLRTGDVSTAVEAYSHAQWLRQRERDPRAAALESVLSRFEEAFAV